MLFNIVNSNGVDVVCEEVCWIIVELEDYGCFGLKWEEWIFYDIGDGCNCKWLIFYLE